MDDYVKGLQQKAGKVGGAMGGIAQGLRNPVAAGMNMGKSAGMGIPKASAQTPPPPSQLLPFGDGGHYGNTAEYKKSFTTPDGQKYYTGPIKTLDYNNQPSVAPRYPTAFLSPQSPNIEYRPGQSAIKGLTEEQNQQVIDDFKSRPESQEYKYYMPPDPYDFKTHKPGEKSVEEQLAEQGITKNNAPSSVNLANRMGIKTAEAGGGTPLRSQPNTGHWSSIKKSFTTPQGKKYYISDVTGLGNPAHRGVAGFPGEPGFNGIIPSDPTVEIDPQQEAGVDMAPWKSGTDYGRGTEQFPGNGYTGTNFTDALKDFQSRPESQNYRAYMETGFPRDFKSTTFGETPDFPGQTYEQWLSSRGISKKNNDKIKSMAQSMPRPNA